MSSQGISNTTETVKFLTSSQNGVVRWEPAKGEETLNLLERFDIPEDGKNRLVKETRSILSKCVPPTHPAESVTGLAIGYVQSGKTMSFTTLTALARDNGYQLVIIIAGTSNPLLDQSTKRLKRDLALDTRPDRSWQHFETRSLRKGDIRTLSKNINNTLSEWNNNLVPRKGCRTVLITAMKQYQHLDKLRQVLAGINDLQTIPALIIDDEADQRSFNTKVKKGEESTTYQSIVALKNVLLHHSFIQYTATPQAPLLINLIDVLSPRFAEILTPGQGYVGGQQYFIHEPKLVNIIPDNEIPSKESSLDAPPDSLISALQLFYIGVAAGLVIDGGTGNRSMLVHPSYERIPHQEYINWINQTVNRWQITLELKDRDPDKLDLLNEFNHAYNELSLTVQELPPLKCITQHLIRAMRRTQKKEVNSRKGPTPTIEWKNEYGHILVGGQAIDRGFTVEGLTITYMPRGTGVGNADTIQQRGRFFGYKDSYLGYCRVFLDQRVKKAFHHYVVHEEDVRQRLHEFSQTGDPLTEWKRAFFLHSQLRPCRANVLDLDYIRGGFGNNWFEPKAPHDSNDAIRSNRSVVQDFVKTLTFQENIGHPQRTDEQRHLIAENVSLREVYENLLTRLIMTRYGDSERFTGTLLQIADYLDRNPNTLCTVYQMSKGRLRNRKTNSKDEIRNLFQGKNPKTGIVIYPGDRQIKTQVELTIQLHNLRVHSDAGVMDNVPAVAVYIPQKMAQDWLIQPGNSIQDQGE